ncbi:MAG: aminopeptidase [Bdellovibrionaceae bacterium]|nr:aminopeptidase [Pseudobdellovibrionaceae bacterium]
MKKTLILILFAICVSGCQIGYIVNNAYHQASMLHSAEPVSKVLADPHLKAEHKQKLELATKAKAFAETRLYLKKTKNYSTYVDLHRPYVTYIVSAAPKNELKYYTWYFPIIGSVPYKGYFTEQGAKQQAKELDDEGYDTYVRGVSAYSTLGWFKDPILSSMMSYSDYDLVNTIIHETVHTTIYIKSNANFNERLASYLGDLGARLFFDETTGSSKELLDITQQEDHDQKLFGEFISEQIKGLEAWYTENKTNPQLEQERMGKFEFIKKEFKDKILSKLKTKKYQSFAEAKLNNAKLLGLKLYMNDLSDFEKLTDKFAGDFPKILAYCKSLESADDPELSLKAFVK